MVSYGDKKQEKHIYIRFCKLDSCRIEFKTTRKWQEFCSEAHRNEYWKLYRRSENEIRREITILKKEQEKMKERLGIRDEI